MCAEVWRKTTKVYKNNKVMMWKADDELFTISKWYALVWIMVQNNETQYNTCTEYNVGAMWPITSSNSFFWAMFAFAKQYISQYLDRKLSTFILRKEQYLIGYVTPAGPVYKSYRVVTRFTAQTFFFNPFDLSPWLQCFPVIEITHRKTF
jgi:hypothetical protein